MPSTKKAEKADAAVRQLDPFEIDRRGGSIFSPHNANQHYRQHGPQLRCESCSKSFDKGAGRRKRFCSDACRKAAERAKEARNSPGAQFSVASGNALNQQTKSIACKRIWPDPCPAPLDLLGRGCRWPKSRKLDRDVWQRILRAEVCAP